MSKYPVFGLVFVLLIACSANRGAQNELPSTPTIAAIHKNLEAYRDKTVALDGIFLGWRGDECRMDAHAGAAITRSDWLFKNGEDCIYVTAGRPQGFDPSDTRQKGRRLRLHAIVRLTKEQKTYLEFVGGKSLD
jgi:hypothetical protein